MTYQFRNATILVVDDMQPMLALVSSLLKMFGFNQVYTASAADEGFEEFCKIKPDILITDWMLQPYDGLELCRKIRQDTRSPNKFVPVIMMTGYSHKVRVEQARDSGITEFLVKPFSAKDLYLRIEQLIEKPRKFVDTGQFFGPDRRRRKGDGYEGLKRRESDQTEIDMIDSGEAESILKNLREQIKKTGAPDRAGKA